MSELSPRETEARLKLKDVDRRSRLADQASETAAPRSRWAVYLVMFYGSLMIFQLNAPIDWTAFHYVSFVGFIALVAMLDFFQRLDKRVDAVVELLGIREGVDPISSSEEGGVSAKESE